MALTSKQRRHLRSLGHHLDPVVHVGKNGLTDGLTGALGDALDTHELIKIRVNVEAPDDRHDVAEQLSEALKADVAQVLGNTVLLYRARKKDPVIKLPKAAG
jgi:RNA-binding protein